MSADPTGEAGSMEVWALRASRLTSRAFVIASVSVALPVLSMITLAMYLPIFELAAHVE